MITNVNYNLSDACRKILENMPFIEFKDGEVSKEKITMVLENGSVIHFVGSVGEAGWESLENNNEHL